MEKLLLEGEELFACDKIDEAEKCFVKIIEKYPDNKQAYNDLGVIAFSRNQSNQAKSYFHQALKIDPGYQDAINNLADIGRTESTTVEDILESNLSDKKISRQNIAIVNPFDNKFNQLYSSYFGQQNDVRVIKASNTDEIVALDPILDWADIIYTPWANEPLIYLSNKKSDTLLISNIRSYEIFFDASMSSVAWDKVDGLIFVADHVREIANEKWSNQLKAIPQTTIYNCVDPNKYQFEKKPPGKNIGYVGYLNAKKGIELLLQCINEAVKIDSEYCFHIAGKFQGERFEHYTKHLISQMNLEKNIVYHGWVKDIPAFLSDKSYIISTSPWEGCPNNIIEAMACGVKPLIHNWRGASDIFPEEFVFNTVDEFISILKSPDYDSLSYHNYVLEHFNAELQLPKIEKFMLSLLDKRGESNTSKSTESSLNLNSWQEVAENKPIENDNEPKTEVSVNFIQQLPQKVQIVNNRKAYTVDFCKNKKVLHIGCVDSGMMKKRIAENNYLHHQIYKVAESLFGVDIDDNGIQLLRNEGFDVETVNVETDINKLQALTNDVDVIVIPEVIEHLSNLGQFLDNLYSCNFDGDILISTPNSFSYRVTEYLSQGVELVHPDHNYYFSLTTLTTILNKHGFDVKSHLMYYWPGNDEFGQKYEKLLDKSPYLAEGIIAIVNRK
ncbi:MAG: glycosyltransferase [candidate division Zixibacteria bacterium]|nr:glycosyltransferase [candidate division Zixibacteria bacterium]